MSNYRTDELPEAVYNLLRNKLDDTTDKIMDFYESDRDLYKIASPSIIFSYEFEILSIMLHVTDYTTFLYQRSKRDPIFLYLFTLASKSIDLKKIDASVPYPTDLLLENRYLKYGLTARGQFRPIGFSFLGTPKDDVQFHLFQLLGDYITYFQEVGRLPTDEDISSTLLYNPISTKAISRTYIIFQTIQPALIDYQRHLICLLENANCQ